MFQLKKMFHLLIDYIIGMIGRSIPKATYVSVEETRKWLKSGDRINLIDIRSRQSFSRDHIPGAINIPIEDIESLRPGDDRNFKASTPILVYCVMGISSDLAGTLLLKNGFTEVYQLEGGFLKWNSGA